MLVASHSAAREPSPPQVPEWSAAPIPEPLLFDLALPLGTERGSVEVNSIFRFPIDGGRVISVPEAEVRRLFGERCRLDRIGEIQTDELPPKFEQLGQVTEAVYHLVKEH